MSGNWYFTQHIYKKIMAILKLNEIIILMFLLSLMIRLVIAIKKRKLKSSMVVSKIGICICQLWIFNFLKNSIFKGNPDSPMIFQWSKYMYHMYRFHASVLFFILYFNFIFITCFVINKFLDIIEKRKKNHRDQMSSS